MSKRVKQLFILLRSIFAVALFLATNVIGFSETINLYDTTKIVALQGNYEILIDESSLMTFADVQKLRFTSWEDSSPNFGFTKKTVWVKFHINHKSGFPFYLTILPEWVPEIKVYRVNSSNIVDSLNFGSIIPVHKRPLRFAQPNMEISNDKDVRETIYLKMHHGHALAFNFLIGQAEFLHRYYNPTNVIYYVFLSIALLILVYNSIFAYLFKRRYSIYYSLYICFVILGVSYIKGFHTFLDFPWIVDHSDAFYSLAIIFVILGLSSFTNLRRNSPYLYYTGWVFLICSALTFLVNISGNILFGSQLLAFTAKVGSVWCWVVPIQCVIKRQKNILLILIGFSFSVLGSTVHILLMDGYLPFNIITENCLISGYILEFICMSTAFGWGVNKFRKDRFLIQEKMLNQIKERDKLIQEQNKLLERKVKERTLELEKSLDQVSSQHKLIEKKNKSIIDGINYAKTIQKSFMPNAFELKEYLPESFVFFEPKDILSGDFYWIGNIEGLTIVAVADCTGHGVPGALLSMTGNAILRQLVYERNLYDPGQILTHLHHEFYSALGQKVNQNNDGMDISIIVINHKENTILFSGANNSLFLVRDGRLEELRGDRMPIGGFQREQNRNFNTQTVKNIDGLSCYMFTDGFQDQFGGKLNKKFLKKRLKHLLLEISRQPFSLQEKILKSKLNSWKGELPQTDDVLVMGFRPLEGTITFYNNNSKGRKLIH